MSELRTLRLRQRLGFLAKDSMVYGLGGALNKAIALITFPILARHFSVTDFGVIDLLNTSIVLMVTLLVFGQDSAVARYYYERDDQSYRRQVISQSLALQGILLTLALPVLFALAGPLAAMLEAGEDGAMILRLMVLQVPFFLLINFSQNILKWTFQRRQFLIVSVGSSLATLVGILCALIWSSLTVVGLFLIYLCVRAAFGLLGLWFVRRWLVLPMGLGYLRPMLPFAIPFGIISFANAAVPVLERNLVAALIDGEALGMFAAGAKVAMLIGLATTAFETSWGPFALSLFREHNAARTFQTVLKLAATGLCAATLLLTAVGDLVIVALGSSRYEGAGIVVFALTMGLTVQSIGAVTEVGIVFAKRPHLKLYSYGLALVVAAISITLLGRTYGIVGVAWGSLAAYISKAILEAWLAQLVHPIDWNYGGAAALVLMTIFVGLVHQVEFHNATAGGLRWIPLAGLPVLLAIAWFLVFDAAERSRVLAQLRKQ